MVENDDKSDNKISSSKKSFQHAYQQAAEGMQPLLKKSFQYIYQIKNDMLSFLSNPMGSHPLL